MPSKVRVPETVAPIGAAATAVLTLLCCLPFGFAAATATAGLSLVVAEQRGWFLALSVGLLALGFVQVARGSRTCSRRRRALSMTVLGVSAAIVVLVTVFPQVVAGILADLLP
jgi:hypothetical protein